jgi:hypothetical protein
MSEMPMGIRDDGLAAGDTTSSPMAFSIIFVNDVTKIKN